MCTNITNVVIKFYHNNNLFWILIPYIDVPIPIRRCPDIPIPQCQSSSPCSTMLSLSARSQQCSTPNLFRCSLARTSVGMLFTFQSLKFFFSVFPCTQHSHQGLFQHIASGGANRQCWKLRGGSSNNPVVYYTAHYCFCLCMHGQNSI